MSRLPCIRALVARLLFPLMLVPGLAVAAPLSLTLNQVTDISAFNFGGVGGLAFDPLSGELWIADAAGSVFGAGPGETNAVARINPLSAASSIVFDAAAGNVFFGPDGVAFNAAANELFLFSAFGDITAGVTDGTGSAVRTLAIDPRRYAGAAFNSSGELWIADREAQTFNPDFLRRLDPATGAQLASVAITGASFNPNLSGLVFDPASGNPFGYDTDQQVLLEIDLGTGAVLSETEVGSFFSDIGVPGGIAFNAIGDRLYLGSGVPLGHPTGVVSELVVLNRFAASEIPLPGAVWLLAGGIVCLGRLAQSHGHKTRA